LWKKTSPLSRRRPTRRGEQERGAGEGINHLEQAIASNPKSRVTVKSNRPLASFPLDPRFFVRGAGENDASGLIYSSA